MSTAQQYQQIKSIKINLKPTHPIQDCNKTTRNHHTGTLVDIKAKKAVLSRNATKVVHSTSF